jgi:hypothetical protein
VVAADVLTAVGDVYPRCRRPLGAATRHEWAVARTLEWADDAAARGDHANALGWLGVLDTMGDQLSSEYRRKRENWRLALRGAHKHG